ncbi:MAG: hypothetical protein FJ222_07135 [Lentisphaerae bacterium]|nr:hypothetical protein [Lentisphaerota bacterium]
METKTTNRGRIAGAPVSAWRRLYDVADHIRALDPWPWMTLGHVFGVQPHGSAEPGFVLFSKQGDPARRAISVYPGWTAFHDAIMSHARPDDRAPLERTIEESWLRLMFMPASGLNPGDRAVLVRLGCDLTRADECPAFCSQKVGYFPDRLGPSEVVWLSAVLYQAYGMAMRVEMTPGLTQERLPRTLLVRKQDAAGDWRDAWVDEPTTRTDVDVSIDLDCVRRIRRHPADATVLQADLVLSPLKRKSAEDHRSEAIFTLLLVNGETRMIIRCDAMQATEGIEAMWAQVPGAVLKGMAQLDVLPSAIEVRSDRMLNVLRPLTELLPFKLTRRENLDALAVARDSLNELLRVKT